MKSGTHAPRPTIVAVLVLWVLCAGAPVAAQVGEWDGRGFVNITGGLQFSSTDFADSLIFTAFAEQGNVDTVYGIDSGVLFDASGGARIWRNLAVGVGVSFFARDDDAAVAAQVPHPFFFDRDRAVIGTASGIRRQETAVHIQGTWFIPASDALTIAVFGGPTFFHVKQDLVTQVGFRQTYPYNTATFDGASTAEQSESTVGFNVGFNVGFDVAYYFSETLGVGWLARFSRATVDFPSQGTVGGVDVGGFHTGAGLRVRF